MLYSSALFVASMLSNPASPSDSVRSEILDGITVSASIANTHVSSLRLGDTDRQKIQENAPGLTFPELIRNVPGVYSSSETGSFGDAKINIRGFKQENISVLIDKYQHLTLTALGSPERHMQRSSRLSYSEVEKYGRNYNKNWGWDENGQQIYC